jgi:hypothetical protein
VKKVKNVNRGNLSKEERADLESCGFSETEAERLGEILKGPQWEFWSRASDLFLTLSGGQEISYANGKMRQSDVSRSAKFTSNFYLTADREQARLLFMSDPYMSGAVKLVSDHTEEEAQKAYKEYKTKILSSKENVERLKRDLAEM